MKEAMFWKPLENGTLQCVLCPRKCVIAPGKRGWCGVRKNEDGILYAETYRRPVAVNIDPIEKKPLKMFLPGTKTFSFGTYGCNLGCLFCQNFDISRGHYSDSEKVTEFSPEELVTLALRHGCPSISYTYNEPGVFYEYMLETAELAHENGLKNVMVTNGFLSPEPAEKIYPLIDAANFDMKGFSEKFYSEMCVGASLKAVLESFRIFKKCGGHAEYTTLVIPGKNDSMTELDAWLDWVDANLGKETPLHFTAYFPMYKYTASPPTPPALLYSIRDHAVKRGFPNIFLGNI